MMSKGLHPVTAELPLGRQAVFPPENIEQGWPTMPGGAGEEEGGDLADAFGPACELVPQLRPVGFGDPFFDPFELH